MTAKELRTIVRSTLLGIGIWSRAAEELLLGTAAQESHLGKYKRQIGGGPALGIYQMEPATERDIWENYLSYRRHIACSINETCGISGPDHDSLENDIKYQTIMARVHYLRVREKLPIAGDLQGQARLENVLQYSSRKRKRV